MLAQEINRGRQGHAYSIREHGFKGAINLRLGKLNRLSLELWGENQLIKLLVAVTAKEGEGSINAS